MTELEKENKALREELTLRVYDIIMLRSALRFYADHCEDAVKSGSDPGRLAKEALQMSQHREDKICTGGIRNDPDYFSR